MGSGHVFAWDNADGNVIYGNAGSNVLYLAGGSDVVDGGAGFDRLVLAGAREDYDVSIRDGLAFIVNHATGDTIKAANITSLSFDAKTDSEIDGLYKAYLGRAASGEGYASGVSRLPTSSRTPMSSRPGWRRLALSR